MDLDRDVTQHYNWDGIPEFVGRNLPPGEWPTTWEEFVSRFAITEHRTRLLSGFQLAVRHLRESGCKLVFVDGGFVTNKKVPEDIDCCWVRTGVNERKLKSEHPAFYNFANKRLAQKVIYSRCEFFPHDFPADARRTPYLNYFQRDRNGKEKGIIVLRTEEVP